MLSTDCLDTKVTHEYNNLTWQTTYRELGYSDPFIELALNCSEVENENDCKAQCTMPSNGRNDSFCIRDTHLEGIGWQIANVFNSSALLAFPTADSYYYFGERTSTFVNDVVGPVPSGCTKAPGLGFDGFKTRVNNVAVSMTNAYVSLLSRIHQSRYPDV